MIRSERPFTDFQRTLVHELCSRVVVSPSVEEAHVVENCRDERVIRS